MAQNLIDVQLDEARLKGIEQMLSGIPRGMPKVVTRALNKTATTARSQTVKAISKKVAIKQKDIRLNVKMWKASYRRWVSTIKITGKRLPLIYFGATQTKRGVGYRIDRGAGRKRAPHAFITTMIKKKKTGEDVEYRGVFARIGKSRFPLRVLRGPSVVGVFQKAPGLAARLLATANRRLEQEIDRQVGVLLEKGR